MAALSRDRARGLWGRFGPAGVAGGVALVVYVLTLAPTVTSEDSGELIAAAHGLGVPHPPGFVLWVLAVHGLITLSPMPVAWTANFSSALFAALTVAGVVVLARRLGASALAAVSGGLALAFGHTFWSQAVIAEVYALNTALFVWALVALVGWAEAPHTTNDRGLRAAALLCGLGLTNHHPLTLLMGPAFAGYALSVTGWGLLRPRRLGPVLLCLILPSLLYLYLLWASARQPAVDWGETRDLHSLWAHVSRQAYRELELSAEVTWHDKLSFMKGFVSLWSWEMTPAVFLVAVGLGSYRLRGRRELSLLWAVVGLNSVLLLSILRFRFEAENIMRVNEYYLPAYVVTAVLLAMGVQALLQRWPAKPAAYAVQAVALALPLWPLMAHLEDNNMSRYWMAADYNRAILQSLPSEAIYFPSGDYVAFPTLYLQAVEGVRPDVLIANYTGSPSVALKAYVRALEPEGPAPSSAQAQEVLLRLSRRPLIFASKSDVRAGGAGLRPWGLVYRLWRGDEPAQPGPQILAQDILRDPQRTGPVDDLGRSLLADYHRALAEAHLAHGSAADAHREFSVAEHFLRDSKEGLNNLGSTRAEYGQPEGAERLYRRAAQLSPTYVTPRRNLALLLDAQGRTEQAIRAFEALLRVAPQDEGARRRLATLKEGPEAAPDPRAQRVLQYQAATRAEPGRAPLWNNLGTAYVEAGQPQEALGAYLEAVRLDPDYAMAHKHLAALYRELLGQPQRAAVHEARYEALKAGR